MQAKMRLVFLLAFKMHSSSIETVIFNLSQTGWHLYLVCFIKYVATYEAGFIPAILRHALS